MELMPGFWPPRPSRFWNVMLAPLRHYYLRRFYKISAVTVGGQEIHLTPTEYELLRILMTHPNRVLTDQMLLRQVWGPSYGSEAHYLHVYMGHLRRKIEADPAQPRYLLTEPGVGYRLQE